MQALLRPGGVTAGTVAPDALPDDPPADTPPDPGRKLVIEGNKAWRAAGEVRKRWIAQLFARRTAPREAARFTAGELLRMPDPLRGGLASATDRDLFSEITGQPAASWLQICETTTAGRLPLLPLGPVVTAYEQAMSDVNTWRTERYSPCPRRDAGRYLTFLASVGYQLASIEQALADDVPWAGDTEPGVPLAAAIGAAEPAGEPGPDGEAGPDGEDVAGDTDLPAPGSEPDGEDAAGDPGEGEA
jgi:ParB family chromosome partitioning protein